MKRPILGICSECGIKKADSLGKLLFRAVKKERKRRGLKPVFKVEKLSCLDRCDRPCNAELRGKHKPTLQLTELDAKRDVVPLVEAAMRYAEAEDASSCEKLVLPGKPLW